MVDGPQGNTEQGDSDQLEGLVPADERPLEVESVRREASAEFAVDGEVGSAAALREAMDPANRSLADALQLSFRVLQLVIIVLLVLFVFSGFKTVGASQGGVATVWGRIIDTQGLQPGLQMNWPPPIGDFVLFEADGREVDDYGVFLPNNFTRRGREYAVDNSTNRDEMQIGGPDSDGYFLTDGGEISHVRMSAEYRIVDPVRYLNAMPDAMADVVVRLAMERAVVHVGGSHKLKALQDDFSNEEIQEMVGDKAQAVLDEIDSGIRISSVVIKNEIMPPMYIIGQQEKFILTKQASDTNIVRAQKEANEMLVKAAGESYLELAKLMRDYEAAWDQDHPDSEARLADINGFFDGEILAGVAARTISTAQRFQARVDQTLGREARRFAGLLPAYREHPELVIAEKWLEAYGSVMDRPDAEIMYVPAGLGSMAIDISGLQSVRDIRRRADIEAREQAKGMLSGTASDYMMRADEIKIDQAQRQLDIDEESGTVRGMRKELLEKDN